MQIKRKVGKTQLVGQEERTLRKKMSREENSNETSDKLENQEKERQRYDKKKKIKQITRQITYFPKLK